MSIFLNPYKKVPDKTACESKGNWTNAKINFDNVLAAYLALFQVVSRPPVTSENRIDL